MWWEREREREWCSTQGCGEREREWVNEWKIKVLITSDGVMKRENINGDGKRDKESDEESDDGDVNGDNEWKRERKSFVDRRDKICIII